jgi:hypothetical protein
MDADPAAPDLAGHLPPDAIYGLRPDVEDDPAVLQAPSAGDPPLGDPRADLSDRLARVEAQVAGLGDRLEALADSVESTLRLAVAEEVGAVAGDLRRTVTELGRLLVRDLGRLTRILGEHRDTIVAELRSAGGSPTGAEGSLPNRRGA